MDDKARAVTMELDPLGLTLDQRRRLTLTELVMKHTNTYTAQIPEVVTYLEKWVMEGVDPNAPLRGTANTSGT